MKMFRDEKPTAGTLCDVLLTNGNKVKRYYVHNGNGDMVWFPNLPEKTDVIEWEAVTL